MHVAPIGLFLYSPIYMKLHRDAAERAPKSACSVSHQANRAFDHVLPRVSRSLRPLEG
jgi:hypothetical protein